MYYSYFYSFFIPYLLFIILLIIYFIFILSPQLASTKFIVTWKKFIIIIIIIIIMVLVKNWPFSHLLISGNIGPQIVFYDSLERENAFLGYKNRNFKTSKNWHFSKRVNPWFWSKSSHFSYFFFTQYRPGKYLLRLSRTTKRLSKLQKQEVQKVKNWHFSKGVNPWFRSKNDNFPTFFILGNIGHEILFYDIPQRKNAFLGYNNKKFKKTKNWHFSKGVNPWLWSKNGHFSNFFF